MTTLLIGCFFPTGHTVMPNEAAEVGLPEWANMLLGSATCGQGVLCAGTG